MPTMTNHKPSLEQTMKTNRNILPWLAGAALACAVLAAPAAQAQTVSTSTPTAIGTVGSTAVKVGAPGSAAGVDPVTKAPVASLGPAIALSGPISITASYIPDPAGGPATMAYSIDATGVSGTDAAGVVFSAASGQASITRPYALSDALVLTMPFFAKTATGYLSARTFALHLSVAVDGTTKAVTSIVSSITNP
jgi:hypothetical protein